jgi:hypothetical protein
VSPLEYGHSWDSGIVRYCGGGVDLGVELDLVSRIEGGQRWVLEETVPGSTSDDKLSISNYYNAESGLGMGVGPSVGVKSSGVSLEAGATVENTVVVQAFGDVTSSYERPYETSALQEQGFQALLQTGCR